MALNEKQRRFVIEYLIDLNATQAAIRAGYSVKTAYSQGQRLLKNVEIAGAISEAMQNRAERVEIDADYVLRQAVKLHERCMQEVEPLTDRKGEHVRDENGNRLYVFNSTGAAKALELVGKHVSVQAFREQVGLTGKDGGPIQTEDISWRDRLRSEKR